MLCLLGGTRAAHVPRLALQTLQCLPPPPLLRPPLLQSVQRAAGGRLECGALQLAAQHNTRTRAAQLPPPPLPILCWPLSARPLCKRPTDDRPTTNRASERPPKAVRVAQLSHCVGRLASSRCKSASRAHSCAIVSLSLSLALQLRRAQDLANRGAGADANELSRVAINFLPAACGPRAVRPAGRVRARPKSHERAGRRSNLARTCCCRLGSVAVLQATAEQLAD